MTFASLTFGRRYLQILLLLYLRPTYSTFKIHFFHFLLALLASALASAKPSWLNFGQHRGPTYSYNNGNKKWQNGWGRFTILIANNNHNTKGHRVVNTKDLNNILLATWQNSKCKLRGKGVWSKSKSDRYFALSSCKKSDIISTEFTAWSAFVRPLKHFCWRTPLHLD